MPLDKYLKAFSRLNRAPGAVWTDATENRAPHKPLLLLSVIDLFAQGQIRDNFIELTPDLSDLFALYWSRVVSPDQRSSIAYPFFHLRKEGFWYLMPAPGKKEGLTAARSISSVTQLRELALGARLDEELASLLQNDNNRETLRAALITANFSEAVRPALLEQGVVNAEAYAYSLELLEKAHGKAGEAIPTYEKPVRDQGFRRAIVSAYARRCALCGISIQSPKGYTVVEAAHIIPWSESKNDDVNNGMALCRLCHWVFDEGMMGVRDDYTVITSPLLAREPNMPGFLLTVSNRPIIGPKDQTLWPAQSSLAWHRKRFRLRQ